MFDRVDREQFLIAASVFGALTSAMLSEDISWRQKATILLSGAGFSVFLVPAACEYYAISSPYAIGACLYLGGFLGNLLLLKLRTWVNTINIVELVRSRLFRKE
jgi:hypothetical protein